MRSKNNYFLLGSVITIIGLIIYIMMNKDDKSLAVLGSLTAFASVILTALINIDRNNLDREKLEIELISSVTKEAYKEIFNQKIAAYKQLLGLIRDYRNEAASDIYEEHGFDKDGNPKVYGETPEGVYANHLKKIIDFMKENELILSKKLYSHYDKINEIYNGISADADEWQRVAAAGPDDWYDGLDTWRTSIYEKTKDMFDELAADLDIEVNNIREKISY